VVERSDTTGSLAAGEDCNPSPGPYAGGVTAISRWLSAATPPVTIRTKRPTPAGVAALGIARRCDALGVDMEMESRNPRVR